MYAIVQLGSHQYKATVGQRMTTEKIEGEVGSEVKFKNILFVSDGKDVRIGDQAKGTVLGKIVAQEKDKKILVFKKKRRHVYKKTQGHRQQYTVFEITEIKG
ncbi:MAG: 50S ribosomal protein L21 [Bdellovibrionales bacterium]|nr:50S ribosomal protein L21 [Bdellovibrionales bacterium]